MWVDVFCFSLESCFVLIELFDLGFCFVRCRIQWICSGSMQCRFVKRIFVLLRCLFSLHSWRYSWHFFYYFWLLILINIDRRSFIDIFLPMQFSWSLVQFSFSFFLLVQLFIYANLFPYYLQLILPVFHLTYEHLWLILDPRNSLLWMWWNQILWMKKKNIERINSRFAWDLPWSFGNCIFHDHTFGHFTELSKIIFKIFFEENFTSLRFDTNDIYLVMFAMKVHRQTFS